MIAVKQRSPWHRSQNPSSVQAKQLGMTQMEQEMAAQLAKLKRSFVLTAVVLPQTASDAWASV
jgi:hypothetical protein